MATASAAAAKMVERKKRTRPVSACEQCRSKKVKCFLLPDQPICKGCAQSGKQCLFRIDDLSPALRRERFPEYDREIEAQKEQQREDEQQQADSAAKRKRRKRQSSHSGGTGDEHEEEEDGGKVKLDKDGKPIKSKAVFRCFANPTKLAAPSVSRPMPSDATSSVAPLNLNQDYFVHHGNASVMLPQQSPPDAASYDSRRPYPTHTYSDQSAGYASGSMQADTPVYASGGMDYSGKAYNGNRFERHDQQHHHAYSQQAYHHPHYAPGPPQLPHFRSSYGSPTSTQAMPYSDRATSASVRQHDYAQPMSPRDYAAAKHQQPPREEGGTWRPMAHRGKGGPPMPRNNGAVGSPNIFAWTPSDHTSMGGAASVHGADDTSSRTTGSVGHGLDRSWPMPPPEQAAVQQADDTPSLAASNGSNSKLLRQSPSSYDGRPTAARPASPTAVRNDLAAASQFQEVDDDERSPANAPPLKRRRRSGGVGFSGSAGGGGPGSAAMGAQSSLASGNESYASPRSSSTTSRPPVTFKKIALPFFRWFGATANTPGIRRIKVGVYHESDMDFAPDEEDEDGEPATRSEEHAALSSPAQGNETASKKPPGGPGEPKLASQSPSVLHPRPLPGKSPHNDHRSPVGAASGHGSPSLFPPLAPHHRTQTPLAESALSTTVRELFETNRPRYPRRDVLLHLVPLFLKYFKASCFPWLDNADLIASAQSGELPAILANAICAMTARFGSHPDLLRAKNASESFADMTKVLIVPMLSWPSIDVIETLVILSYAEFGAGADAGLWMYVGMALRMATDLGLQHELTIRSMATPKQQERARYLFWAIVSLDRITCFGTGRPVTVRDDAYDCALPPLLHDTTADGFVFGHIVRTLLKRGRIGELLNRRDDGLTLEQRGAQLRALWLDLAEFYESLPPDLHFGVNTFRKLAAVDKGCAFVYLHILLQSTISLLNRPSLLRRFDRDFSITAPSRLASIASHASGTIVSILRFAADAGQHRARSGDENADVNPYIDCNPYLDQLILPAGRAFLSEREAAKDTLRSFGHPATQSRPMTANGLAEKESGEEEDVKEKRQDGSIVAAATQSAAGQELPPSSSSFSSELFQGLHTRRQYAQTNIATCQEVLDRVARWWSGASWPARALRQESEGAVDGDVGPDGTDEEAQPAPIRDVEMVLRWARARRIRANRITPPSPSRRASVVSLGQQPGGGGEEGAPTHSGFTPAAIAGGGEPGLAGYGAALAGEFDGGGAWNGTSPLGLGFSGSFGAGAEVDVDALISAWARELGTIESTAAVQGVGGGGGGGGARVDYTPATTPAALRTALTTRSRPASRAHRRVESSNIGGGSRAAGAVVQDGGAMQQHHHHQQHDYMPSGNIDIQSWALGSSGPMDIDLSAMQLEEFFFEPHSMEQQQQNHGAPAAADGKTDASLVMAPPVAQSPSMFGQQRQHGGSTSGAYSQHHMPTQQQQHVDMGPPPPSVLTSTISHDPTSIMLLQDLDMLPSALLNTFNFHSGAAPTRNVNAGFDGGHQQQQQHAQPLHHNHHANPHTSTISSTKRR